MKSEVFKVELGHIKNDDVRLSCETLLNMLPDYFYEIPASSTGKYHPAYTTGKRGLIRHVKGAVRIFFELMQDDTIKEKYTDLEIDIMLTALILHDGLKSGKIYNKYTCVDHPTLMKNFIMENKEKLKLNDEEINLLGAVIESHMGPWNKDYEGNTVLPLPKTKYERLVHMCDYLASRKFLNIDFDADDNIKE